MLAALFSSFFESYLPSHKILRRFKIDFREFPEHRSKKTAPYFIFVYVWNEKKGRNQHAQFLSSSPSSCSLRVRCFPCSLVLKVELVPPSLLRSPMFRLPSGLYFNACLGSLFVSTHLKLVKTLKENSTLEKTSSSQGRLENQRPDKKMKPVLLWARHRDATYRQTCSYNRLCDEQLDE